MTIKTLLAFLVWTLCTLVAHSCAKQWLILNNSFQDVLWLTTIQISTGVVFGWLHCLVEGKKVLQMKDYEASVLYGKE